MTTSDIDAILDAAELSIRKAMSLKDTEPTPPLVRRRVMGILLCKSVDWFERRVSQGRGVPAVRVGRHALYDWRSVLESALAGKL